jgi:hypothetical protein
VRKILGGIEVWWWYEVVNRRRLVIERRRVIESVEVEDVSIV